MDSLTHSHSKQYTFIHITVTVWKLGLQYVQISKIFGFMTLYFFKGNKFLGHNIKRWKKKKKRKEKKRGEGSRNPGQGRVGFGPTWFWAELVLGLQLVLGRVGFGPTWFGPSWFWAELTRERWEYMSIFFFNFASCESLSDQGRGGPRDPRFVFSAFYHFCFRFFHRYFVHCNYYRIYASFDKKKKSIVAQYQMTFQ